MKTPAELRAAIREVPDFPKPGILFFDVTTLVLDSDALSSAADLIIRGFEGERIDVVAGIESRGFIIGAVVAQKLGVGLALVRKKGKLPAATVRESYDLEYGTDTIEMHVDAVKPGQRVLLIDDLLATGGTAAAACKLIEQVKGEIVGCGFIVELTFLPGRAKLAGRKVAALVDYASEEK